MIRHKISDLEEKEIDHTSVIADKDGEVIGRKGSVARLTEAFKQIEVPTGSSNSSSRTNVKVLKQKGSTNLSNSQRTPDTTDFGRSNIRSNNFEVNRNTKSINRMVSDDDLWNKLPNKIFETKYSFIEDKDDAIKEQKDEEKEVVESWEEFHTVPIDNINNSSGGDIFPDRHSAIEHILAKRRESETDHRKIGHGKGLAEIFSDYQTRGRIPGSGGLIGYPIKRGEMFIENSIDTTSGPRTIDIVPGCINPVDSIINPYQSSFHISKENPLYTNVDDVQDNIGKNKWRMN